MAVCSFVLARAESLSSRARSMYSAKPGMPRDTRRRMPGALEAQPSKRTVTAKRRSGRAVLSLREIRRSGRKLDGLLDGPPRSLASAAFGEHDDRAYAAAFTRWRLPRAGDDVVRSPP